MHRKTSKEEEKPLSTEFANHHLQVTLLTKISLSFLPISFYLLRE